MPAVATYGATGSPNLDGLLSGIKWGVATLTYSFPTSGSFYGAGYGNGENAKGFEAFTAAQQTAVKAALANIAAVANLTFKQVTESASTHGDLRYAESDLPSTAWGYYPTTAAVGGDMWYNNSKNYYDNPLKGNYAWATILHETGHTLGLKHPHEVAGAFGALPTNVDSLEYTVMSYRSFIGASTTTGYVNQTSSFPQTLMMLDIAALQQLYGANFATNAGNTVYKFDAATGQMFVNGAGQGAPSGNKIFLTIWDGGGEDTYDFSNYANALKVNLNPGGWSTLSQTQLADLDAFHPGTKLAAGNVANALLYKGSTASLIENAIGGKGADALTGNSANNKLTGNGGNDTLNGGAGTDTAVYSGAKANYSWVFLADGSVRVTDLRSGSPDGTDLLYNIEALKFSDSTVSLAAPTTTNVAPKITSGAQAVSLTEWADKSANETANVAHTASGAVTFSDPNTADAHSAKVTAGGTGYKGTFTIDTSAIDSGGAVKWAFTIADSAMDSLAAGQTLKQTYTIAIDDGRGGVTSQAVTVTLIGTADAAATTTISTYTMPTRGAGLADDDHGPDNLPAWVGGPAVGRGFVDHGIAAWGVGPLAQNSGFWHDGHFVA